MCDFINESGLDFYDITSETYREYLSFSDQHPLKIDGNPIAVNVSKSGGHRLFTSTGWSYYIQPKERWAIRWKSKEGLPNFVK